MTCYHCKFEIPEGAKICGHCRKVPRFQPVKTLWQITFMALLLFFLVPLVWAMLKALF